ncbi:MAG: biopolymer transporter ExbD [Myxococcota bacterium]
MRPLPRARRGSPYRNQIEVALSDLLTEVCMRLIPAVSFQPPGYRPGPRMRRSRVLGGSAVPRRRGDDGLMLTPMVDMFTLLVVYLMQSFGSGDESLMSSKHLSLPVARHADDPAALPSVTLVQDVVMVDGVTVARLDETGAIITPLRDRLMAARETGADGVNVLADRALPYGTIRRVMSSIEEAGISNVNLAVVRP